MQLASQLCFSLTCDKNLRAEWRHSRVSWLLSTVTLNFGISSTMKRFQFDKIITTFTSLSSESLLAIVIAFQVKIICNDIQCASSGWFPFLTFKTNQSCTFTILPRGDFQNCATFPGSKKHAHACQVCRRKNRPKVITLP